MKHFFAIRHWPKNKLRAIVLFAVVDENKLVPFAIRSRLLKNYSLLGTFFYSP